jgi:hypothetical protein
VVEDVTELQKRYAELREEGYGHYQALTLLAERIGLDKPTVKRVLQQAEEVNGPSYQGEEMNQFSPSEHRRVGQLERSAREPRAARSGLWKWLGAYVATANCPEEEWTRLLQACVPAMLVLAAPMSPNRPQRRS